MPALVRNIPDGNWDGNCRQIQIKVSKNCKQLLRNFCICQRIITCAVKRCHSNDSVVLFA